jgi:hypothetical protein
VTSAGIDQTTASADASTSAQPPKAARWRRWTAGFLVVLSCVLAPLTVVSIWVRNQVLNTDRYVSTVAPLASNPDVINTAATEITNTLFDKIDVESIAKKALPKRAEFIAPALETGLRQVTFELAVKFMSTEQFQQLWKEANKRAHAQLVKALTNQGKVVKTANGEVVLDFSAIVEQVRLALDQRGIGIFDRIPIDELATQFKLVDAKNLEKAQKATHLLDTLRWLLPVLLLASLGGALALTSNRRRTLIRWGIGTAVAVAVAGAALAWGRSLYLDSVVSPTLPKATASAVFDTLVRYLRYGIRLMLAVGLIVAFIAWLSGPARFATRIRNTVTRGGTAAGEHGLTFGSFGTWVAAHRRPVRVGTVLLALLALLLWNHPRASTVLLITILTLLTLAFEEFVARAGSIDLTSQG